MQISDIIDSNDLFLDKGINFTFRYFTNSRNKKHNSRDIGGNAEGVTAHNLVEQHSPTDV